MKRARKVFWVVVGVAVLTLALTSEGMTAVTQKAKPSKSGAKGYGFPADRDAAVVAVTREVLKQIYAGKVDPALMTPSMRAAYPPAKIKGLRKDLSSFGPVKSVTLVDRKPGQGKDVATLKVKLGDTVFIGTMTITNDNRMDTFLLLEE